MGIKNLLFKRVSEMASVNKQLETGKRAVVDSEYYNGEWQKYRYGLLKSDFQIVVASMVGETSWGQGYYFDLDDMPKAEKYYNDLVLEYRGIA